MRRTINFENQEAIWDEERGILYTHITESFHSAGNTYGWQGDPAGVGLNDKIIEFSVKQFATIIMTIGTDQTPLYTEGYKWRDFCVQHNSFYIKNTDKGKITLFVIQLSQLKQALLKEEETQTLLPARMI